MILTVVVKEPDKDAELRDIDTDNVLRTLQGLVGGYVQQVPIGPGVNILVNDDGLALNLPDNCGFVGTLVFVQDVFISEDEGWDWGSLSEANIRKSLAWCKKYTGLPHPDRRGGFRLMTDEAEIKAYRQKLAEDAQAKVLDWQSL